MKKLLLAVAAFAVLFTSCAKDETVAPVENEALVSFCVKSPAVATRYGEGTTAQELYYAVYDENGLVEQISKVNESVEIKLSTTVELKLIQGRSYDVLFWAASEGAPYTVDWTNKTMTVSDVLKANQESYDAFFKYESLGKVSGAVSKTIELRRPFAQLNIATGDTDDAANAEFTVATTGVTVSKIYSKMSLETGAVDTTTETAVTFAMANKADGTITVGENDYDQIAMNYLLVGDKKLVNVELSLSEENSTEVLTRNYSSVPVQRNYRTNIVGNILTSPAQFNVVILPGFEEDEHPFTDEDKLAMAAQTSGVYELTEDVVLTAPIVIPAGVKFELNLNGKNITATSGNAIKNNGTLVIKGNTTTRTSGVAAVISETTYGVNNSGTLTVDGVKVNAIYNSGELTFNDGIVENTISGRHGIYHCGSKLVINNGTFSSTSGNELIHAATANTTTINGGTFTQIGKSYLLGSGSAAIAINGGSFNGYVNDNGTNDKMRPGSAVVKGGTFNFDPTAWVAEGYKAMENDGKYVVVPEDDEVEDVVVVGTAQDLKDALNSLVAGNMVVLEKDINLTGEEWSVSMPWQGSATDVIFDGNGHKIIGLSTTGLQGGLLGKYNSNGNITIKNLTLVDVTITGTNVDGESAGGALIGWIENHGAGSITIENVKVEGIKAEGFKYIGGLIGYNNGNVAMNVVGCSVIGKADSYLNSTYNEGGNYKGHVGGLLGLWMKGSLTNSQVKDLAIKHGTNDMTGSSNRAGALVGTKYSGVEVVSATVENVTVDGAAATVASLFGPNASSATDSDKANVVIK